MRRASFVFVALVDFALAVVSWNDVHTSANIWLALANGLIAGLFVLAGVTSGTRAFRD